MEKNLEDTPSATLIILLYIAKIVGLSLPWIKSDS